LLDRRRRRVSGGEWGVGADNGRASVGLVGGGKRRRRARRAAIRSGEDWPPFSPDSGCPVALPGGQLHQRPRGFE